MGTIRFRVGTIRNGRFNYQVVVQLGHKFMINPRRFYRKSSALKLADKTHNMVKGRIEAEGISNPDTIPTGFPMDIGIGVN
jgi:hypothetical protein